MSTNPRITIQSKAPTRIDLSGGTLDLWPLYLFLDHPLTINLAISLFAETEIEISQGAGPVTLRSEDQNIELSLNWSDLNQTRTAPPQLALHFKLLKFFFDQRREYGWGLPNQGFRLTTRAQSPAGAGLGGSSTLSISLIGALATWASTDDPFRHPLQPIDPAKSGEAFIEIVRDVETTVIQVPAGLQDYYGAMYGGLQCLRWGAGTHRRESLDPRLISELEKRILLFYSGHSRNSGINNWALFKNFIDKKEGVRDQFQKISTATHQLEKALRTSNWDEVGQAITAEWQTRKTLAPGITTPEIDQAYLESTHAFSNSGISGKVCGAGGGGCFFVYLTHPTLEARQTVEAVFMKNGMKSLPYRGALNGLEVILR